MESTLHSGTVYKYEGLLWFAKEWAQRSVKVVETHKSFFLVTMHHSKPNVESSRIDLVGHSVYTYDVEEMSCQYGFGLEADNSRPILLACAVEEDRKAWVAACIRGGACRIQKNKPAALPKNRPIKRLSTLLSHEDDQHRSSPLVSIDEKVEEAIDLPLPVVPVELHPLLQEKLQGVEDALTALRVTMRDAAVTGDVEASENMELFLPIAHEMALRMRVQRMVQSLVNNGVGTSILHPPNPMHWTILHGVPKTYWPVVKLMLVPSEELIRSILRSALPNELDAVANALLSVAELCGSTVALLRVILAMEIEQTKSEQVLFRSGSLASKLITLYAEHENADLLTKMLMPSAKQTLELSKTQSFELSRHRVKKVLQDIKKTEPTEEEIDVQCKQNQAALQATTKMVLEHISANLEKASPSLRGIVTCQLRGVLRRFPEARPASVVGGTLFLRWICPWLVDPSQYGQAADDVKAPLPKYARNNFISVCRILQKLSNGQLFSESSSERNLVGLNDFLSLEIPKLAITLEAFANPSEHILFTTSYHREPAQVEAEVKSKEGDLKVLQSLLSASIMVQDTTWFSRASAATVSATRYPATRVVQ